MIMKTINDLRLEHREKCAISEASKVLKEKFLVEKVVLFGSKARGDDDMESDIDLLEQVLVMADHQDTVARCNSKQGNKAHQRGDTYYAAGKVHRPNTTDQSQGEVGQDKQ